MTGGQLKGRNVITPQGVRPTLSKVRESVFNILFSEAGDYKDRIFLDMFAASGLVGIEAASRGFKVYSYEKFPSVAKITKENYKTLGLDVNFTVTDSIKALKKSKNLFDVIYADPPWNFDYEQILFCASDALNNGGILICESDKKKKPKISQIKIPEGLELFKEKIYGRCELAFFKKS